MTAPKYTVTAPGVLATVDDGTAAYNTARAIAHAVARINPGVEVSLDMRGRGVERYVGRERPAVDVERVGTRRRKRTPDDE